MREINPSNDDRRFGHDHNYLPKSSEENAEIISFPAIPPKSKTELVTSKNKWQTSLVYGAFAGMLGGIIAFPAIDMIESENGFNFEIPGSLNIGATAVAVVSFVSTAVYKYLKG
jgi:hypothetical protein